MVLDDENIGVSCLVQSVPYEPVCRCKGGGLVVFVCLLDYLFGRKIDGGLLTSTVA